MSQFDLVEDYLTNRLDDGARSAFEEQMKADPQLKAEVNMQKGIIEGVKAARVAELKAMLNNVPVGGVSSALTGKIAMATITAGIIGAAVYFGLKPSPTEEQEVVENTVEEQIPLPSIEEPTIETETITRPVEEEAEPRQPEKKVIPKTEQPKKEVSTTPPSIDVLDLTEDISENTEDVTAPKAGNKPTPPSSKIEVEINDHKDYSFHYQFKGSRLALYGPFDSSLYEIIELNGAVHSIFLYYDDSFYHLDQKEHKVAPLIMIRDIELLDKLEQYRKKN